MPHALPAVFAHISIGPYACRVAQQTAASILTSLLGRDSDFRSIIVDQLEALSDIEAVAAWSEDEGLLEAITKAAAASIPAAESTLEAGFQDPQKAAR